MITKTNQKKNAPQRIASGTALSLAESTAKLFGRSIFKNHVLGLFGAATLVVTAVEYGIGAMVLLLVAYSPRLLRGERGRTNERPARLPFSKQVVGLMLCIGGLNILGRAFSAFALAIPEMSMALFSAIGLCVPVLLFSIEGWHEHRIAALTVPVLMVAGLAIAAEVWDRRGSIQGIGWATAGGLCSLLYLPLSRRVLDMGKAPADQFQALNTFIGAIGIAVWALIDGKSLTEGWSWRLVIVLMITSFLSVVLPRYLHVMTRRAVGDGFYAILSTLSLVLALGVDYVMEHRTPTVWQVIGLTSVGLVTLAVAYLKHREDQR